MGGPARSREHAQVSASFAFSVSVKPVCLPVCPPRRDLEEMGYSMGLVLRNSFLGAYARRDMTSRCLAIAMRASSSLLIYM